MAETSAEYLRGELERLDLLIHREILRLRAVYQLSLDEFRGLYVSDQQVDNLLREDRSAPEIIDPAELTVSAARLHEENVKRLSPDSPWSRLRHEFDLAPCELDVLLLALALELHPKYETLCAYLNNDVTRKWPTCDLALRLFAADAETQMKLRESLLPHAQLFASGLLNSVQASQERRPWLSTGFFLAPELYCYLMQISAASGKDREFVDRIKPKITLEEIPVPGALRTQLSRVPEVLARACQCEAPLLVLVGRQGSPTRQIAEGLCSRLKKELLVVSFERARIAQESPRKTLQSVLLQQRLEGSAIFIDDCGALFAAEGHPTTEAFALIAQCAAAHNPIFLSLEPHMRWRELFRGVRKLIFEVEDPDFDERKMLWSVFGKNLIPESVASDLADRFVLNPGQISDAITTARDHHYLRQGSNGVLTADELLEGARAQSDQNLGKLATRLRGAHTWKDLVLPSTTLQQLKEISSAIQFRHQVYSSWGFDQRLVSGRGLKILFSGSAGTGKTMTAGIIARDLGLDLYKIDLSGIVSKFIGETEKNLDRIFHAAQSGNAILFFDEADALFGKRSEVKDAHDRYANIEVAYLLQKMEDHDGVVILATNLSKNLDEAFSRRMHYVVEFPVPNAAHREQLWRGMFPPQAPVSEDVDFKFLAEQFSLAGGDIRNIVLSAAFLAAKDGSAIQMRHLVPALGRLMIKKGKAPSATEFKQYHAWLSPAEQ